MNLTPANILALTNEAALLIQRGRVAYANAAARGLLGEDCTGKTARSLLGEEILETQASSFVANIPLSGHACIVRVSRSEAGQIVFLSRTETMPALVNDPFLCELRGGLMNISMAADSMRKQADCLQDAGLLADLQVLTRSYYRLLRLTGNASLVLTAAQGGLPVSWSTFDLSALCRSILGLVGHFYPEFQCRAELEESALLTADYTLLKQLVLNLLANCIAHAGAEACTVLRTTVTAGSVILSVSDNGRGIPPELLHTVFDRYRHSFGLGEMNRGPGLGLTVSRLITMAHQGTLLLESRPGQGTTVRASFSRDRNVPTTVHAPDVGADTLVQDVLVGLSGCLPAACYTESYMD